MMPGASQSLDLEPEFAVLQICTGELRAFFFFFSGPNHWVGSVPCALKPCLIATFYDTVLPVLRDRSGGTVRELPRKRGIYCTITIVGFKLSTLSICSPASTRIARAI